MIRILAAAVLLASAMAAHAQNIMAPPFDRTFHYERSNRDGSEPEQIYFHRAAPNRVEVYKMVERCTRSAFVTAFIDPQTGVATRLVAARLGPNAARAEYATLDAKALDGGGTAIRLTLETDNGPYSEAIALIPGPWHDYDYDLGTLAAALQARPGSRAGFSFEMTMVGELPGAPGKILHALGTVTARFAAVETHLGVETLRFEVTGTAFGEAGGGPLWVDARDSHIVDVQWGRPNHDNYKDFRLRLIGEEPAGEAAWTALLTRHFEGCPPPSGG